MAGKKEYELAIKIAGMVDASLASSCNLTKKQLREIAKEAANANHNSIGFSMAMTQAGPGIDMAWNGAKKVVMSTAEAMLAAGAAVGVVGGLAINAGSDFESAFAGVRKTVDASEEQFAELEAGLREMAKNKPQTAVELAEIAEAAGQLGIHTENIKDFTDTMADLKVATNLGDEGAAQFAKFANIVGMSQDKFGNLGSTVVALGNNSATTEADIMEMAMRLAGAGKQVDMSEAQILGFAASMSSVGIEAEAGGSAMSKMMVSMQLAVEKGGGELKQFARVANMSSKDFQTAFKEDAAGAMTAFISGLNDTDRLGTSAIATLDEMGIKEVRLRDTLLRAANASGLFGDTLNLASEAFEENTALTREAEQRYATFESRLGMIKNRVNDVGISLYQDFRDPLSDCLDLAMDFADNSNMFDSKYIEEMAKNFQKNIPTVVRQLGDAKESFMEFADPVIKIGTWMMDNPDVITGTLAGIGTTLVTLKVAKTIHETAGAMNALKVAMMSNPITAAIGIAALAGGAIIGVSTKVKMANAELKKQNLSSHFGDISLSLGELEDAAFQIIDNGSLTKLGTVMDEFSKVKELAEGLADGQSEIDKLNWKIGMGFELSEIENAAYGQQIDSFIKNSIALGEQQQYTMNVNLELLTDDDETGQGIINQFNMFYNGLNETLRGYGEELGEVYAEGMKDGVLSLDEVEAIQELQKKMADITAKLSSSQFEAKMESIGIKYGGGQLDADSFQNLQSEIQSQVEEASFNLQESLTMNIAGAKLQLEEGAIDSSQYENMVNEFKGNYLEQIGEIQIKASSFQTDTLYEQYGNELDEVLPQLNEFMSTRMSDYFATAQMGGNADLSYNGLMSGFKDGLTKDSKAAISELWDNMSPDLAKLESIKRQYQDAGKAVPEELATAISDTAALGVIAGSQDALWSFVGSEAQTSAEYKKTIETMKANGYALPDVVAEGIGENKASVHNRINLVYDEAKRYANMKFSNLTVDSRLKVNFAMSNPYQNVGNGVAHADGGIFDKPHWGVFAEAGPEAFIPLDGSPNAVSIWQKAGQELGVIGNSSQASYASSSMTDNRESKTTYSPVYHVYGATEETVRNATHDDYERFESFMQQHERTQDRLSY